MIDIARIDARTVAIIDAAGASALLDDVRRLAAVVAHHGRDAAVHHALTAALAAVVVAGRLERAAGNVANPGHIHRHGSDQPAGSKHPPGHVELVTVAQAARELDVAPRTLRRRCRQGHIAGATQDALGVWWVPLAALTKETA